jgi:hypothetical protein
MGQWLPPLPDCESRDMVDERKGTHRENPPKPIAIYVMGSVPSGVLRSVSTWQIQPLNRQKHGSS